MLVEANKEARRIDSTQLFYQGANRRGKNEARRIDSTQLLSAWTRFIDCYGCRTDIAASFGERHCQLGLHMDDVLGAACARSDHGFVLSTGLLSGKKLQDVLLQTVFSGALAYVYCLVDTFSMGLGTSSITNTASKRSAALTTLSGGIDGMSSIGLPVFGKWFLCHLVSLSAKPSVCKWTLRINDNQSCRSCCFTRAWYRNSSI